MKSATKVTVSTFGVLAALAGLEHGIGEILQGNTAPEGIVIESWPHWEPMQIVSGEPAMTIVPNLLVSGILTVLISLIFLAWVTLFIERKHGGLVLILLSILLLLVGGGFGPPLLGILLGITATRIHAPLTWWRKLLPVGLQRFLARVWLGSLVAAFCAWLVMFPGSILLGYYGNVDDPNLVPVLVFLAFGLLLLTIVAGFAYDIRQQTNVSHSPPLRVGRNRMGRSTL